MSIPSSNSDDLADLRRRIELLEDENQRLREKIEPVFGPDNPAFNPREFLKALRRPLLLVMLPVYFIGFLAVPLTIKARRMVPATTIGGVRFIDVSGIGTRHPGVGIGVIGVGGLGIGLLGIGGLGVGVVAIGGGSIGIFAVGGGSLGIVAMGGGACGYIAIGGGAAGKYALGQRGAGKYVLALNRQDDEAIEFFCRWIPRLRDAVTRPMPVIPMPPKPAA